MLVLFLAAIVWGFAFTAQNMGADSLGPLYFNALRSILAAVVLVPVVLVFETNATDRAKQKSTLIYGSIAGAVLFIASNLQQLGIGLTDSSGKAGFITGLYMLIVPFIAIFLGKRTSLRIWLCAALGVLGLFLICVTGEGFSFSFGDTVLVLCAVFYSVQITVIDSASSKIYPIRFAFVQALVAGLLSLLFALPLESISVSAVESALIPILYCGIMSSGVGYTLQIVGQTRCDPTIASLIMSTESVFSVIGGAIILSERMSPSAYTGCAIIFAAIVISQLPGRKTT